MKKIGMRRVDNYFFLLCIVISVTILTFMALEYLHTPISIILSWLVGAVIIGIFCIFAIKNYSNKIEKLLPLYQPLFHYLRNVISSSQSVHVLQDTCLEEVKKIREDTDNEEISQVLCHPNFRKVVSCWDRTDTIATFHALDSLRILSNSFLDEEFCSPILDTFFNVDKIRNSIIKRYESCNGKGYWYANVENKNTSFEASYAALRIAQSFLAVKGKKCSLENLKFILGEEKINKFYQHLKKCKDADTGGFRDIYEEKPSISSTGLAIKMASILCGNSNTNKKILPDKINRIFDFSKGATPLTFITNCVRKFEINGKPAMGFSHNVNDKKMPMICSTFFALTSLNILGETNLIKDKKNFNPLFNFLDECIVESKDPKTNQIIKGFKATPEFLKGDIMHTFYALFSADFFFPKYLKKKGDNFFIELSRFLDTCNTGVGYGFGIKWTPNVFATCLARRINGIIDKYHKTQKINYNPRESVKFYLSCFEENEFAFTGYPLKRPIDSFKNV